MRHNHALLRSRKAQQDPIVLAAEFSHILSA